MRSNLENKIAIVTGGGRGIGRAIAERLATLMDQNFRTGTYGQPANSMILLGIVGREERI